MQFVENPINIKMLRPAKVKVNNHSTSITIH